MVNGRDASRLVLGFWVQWQGFDIPRIDDENINALPQHCISSFSSVDCLPSS
jgi:hypothetical protein